MPPPSAKQLEARLGFNFELGISRDPRAKRTPETFRLLQRLDKINTRYVSYKIKRIRESKGIKRRTSEILKDLGSTLWPDFDEKTGKRSTPWLFDASDQSAPYERHAEYSKDLVFSDPIDCATISERFREFVEQRLLRYHSNNFKNLPTAYDPPDSDCQTNSEDSEANEDAGEEETETQSDYCPPKSGRSNDFDGMRRSGKMNTYAAPIAPMIPESSSMGNNQAKLDAENIAPNRATPSQYQKQYLTSTHDPVARGSRSEPASYSDSDSGILFEDDPNSSAQNSLEPPLWYQELEARRASKRVRSDESEAGGSLKRGKYAGEVPYPRLRLVVKLKVKLTRGKIPQDAPCQRTGAETNTPAAPLIPPERPNVRLESHNNMPLTQECHVLSSTLKSHGSENTAAPSSRGSHNQPQGSDKVTDTAAADVPATNDPTCNSNGAVTEGIGRDVRGREEFVAALQDLEDKATRQRAAAKTSEIPNAVEQGHVEPQTQVLENNTPMVTSTQILDDEAGHSTVAEASKSPAKVGPPLAPTHPIEKIACVSAETAKIMQGVILCVSMKREGQKDTEDLCVLEKLDITSGSYFFSEDIRADLGDNLDENDTIKQAKVKRTSEAQIKGLKTEFTIVRGSKRNISWEFMLKGLKKIYARDGTFVNLELEVCLLVEKKLDENAVNGVL